LSEDFKICSKCKELRNKNEFYKNGNYLSSRCIYCRSDKNKEEFLLEKENIKKNLKKCSKCKEWKKYNEFARYNIFNNKLKSRCKKCEKEDRELNRENLKKQRYKKKKEKYKYDKIYRNSLVKFSSSLTIQLLDFNYEIRNNNGYLETKCKFCKKWFSPTNKQLRHRLDAVKGKCKTLGIENHLYCSDKCKDNCDIYNLRSDPKKPKINYKNNPEWVKAVLEQAIYQCEICGNREDLCAHHIIPVTINPLLAEDIDNGVCLCNNHHKFIHRLPKCTLGYLRKISCIRKKDGDNIESSSNGRSTSP
jgi:hypothetical protein